MTDLDGRCGEAWAIANCDADGCPQVNRTCQRMLTSSQERLAILKLRMLYSLRKTAKSLKLLSILSFTGEQGLRRVLRVTRARSEGCSCGILAETIGQA
jgi:hypothetical protein